MNDKKVDELTDLLKSAKNKINDLNEQLGYSEGQRASLASILHDESERCLGWQEHAKSLSRTLEVISEFQNSLMKQAVIDNGR